ncbi:uncharacterized protein PAC_15877 [Phialocephala subalpina]|uniref:C2H2-type domain-containing protein n=1 Tax=Phialocephala subalpina TaxID=576137 RepID=A0A1L7XM05_9HELO|nr:uncharacterized protein PAC_15877 [Phialocephala subalpina]
MFANHHVQYISNDESIDGSFSICPSSSSSFSSDASSSPWESEMVMLAPSSTPRRGSPSSVKLERTPSQTSFASTPICSPNRYNFQTAFCPTMAQDMMSFTDPNFLYQDDDSLGPGSDSYVDYVHQLNSYNNSSTSLNIGANHGLPNVLVCDTFQANQSMSLEPPALDLDLYSPESGMSSSPTSEDFVIPSQTTFINAFDLQSPMAPVKSLHFDIAYDSPLSEFGSSFAVDGDSMHGSDTTQMPYYIPSDPTYSELKSSSTTPSRSSSLRHFVFRPPPSTAALQHIQDIKPEKLSRTRSYRDFKREEVYRDIRNSSSPQSASSASKLKRLKRESKDVFMGNIKIQRPARKECPYEGCTGKFQRQEHLKRHERTHLKDAEVYPCEFCPKTFGRSDNLKSHVWLHTLPDGAKKSRRTAYDANALAEYQRMDRKRKGGSSQEHYGDIKQEEGGKMTRTSTKLRTRISGY